MKALKSKRSRIIFSVAIILLVGCLVVVAVIGNSGLENGFNVTSEYGISSKRCAYKSDKNKFNIDEVKLEFFYGVCYIGPVEHEYECGLSYPVFELWFENNEGERIFIKKVEENLVSEKYRCYEKRNIFGKLVGFDFNYSEFITVPKEIFTSETGTVVLSIYGETFHKQLETMVTEHIASAGFDYKIVGDKVILSDKPFD